MAQVAIAGNGLPVHADILGWCFGHSSLTTAVDATIGAQRALGTRQVQ